MKKAGKFLAAIASAALIGSAATACSSSQDTGVQYVYVSGYYDNHHHYHTYSTPRRMTLKYYNSHKNSYPKPYKTVKVTPPKSVNKTPKSSSTKKPGGFSYKKKSH